MDQTSGVTNPPPPASAFNRFLLVAGLAQVAATFTPAGHVRILGNVSFVGLPSAGAAFVVLGLLASVTALRPRGWWRWGPGVVSLALLAVIYMRLRSAPTGGFFDPVLRRVVQPAWGFFPMTFAALLMLSAAAAVRFDLRNREISPRPR